MFRGIALIPPILSAVCVAVYLCSIFVRTKMRRMRVRREAEMIPDGSEVKASFAVDAIPGYVVITLEGADQDSESGFQFSIPLPVKEAVDLISLLSGALSEATEQFDWSEMEYGDE